MKNRTLQQVFGYALGGALVLVVLPFAFYALSRAIDPVLGFALFSSDAARIAVAAALALIAVPFAVSSLVVQNAIGGGGPLEGANIEISPRTRHLVVVGPYRCTRNPMLFGAVSLYFAFAAFLNSPAALAAVVLFAVSMLIFVKLTEEKRLLKDFGEEYEKYRSRVSMFVPWPPRKRA